MGNEHESSVASCDTVGASYRHKEPNTKENRLYASNNINFKHRQIYSMLS